MRAKSPMRLKYMGQNDKKYKKYTFKVKKTPTTCSYTQSKIKIIASFAHQMYLLLTLFFYFILCRTNKKLL